MNKITMLAGMAVATSAMTASADILLDVDLAVVDQITITATSGLSVADASGWNFIGFLMADFFSGPGDTVTENLVSGDLTSANNPSDGSPDLYRAGSGADTGLNVWEFSTDPTVTFTVGTVAFTGSATWTIDAATYADMLAGNTSGDIYFAADNSASIPDATFLGTWNVIPAPSSVALLGLGGMVCIRRRR